MLDKIINESKAYYCVECRKCSSACPVTRVYGKFSPASIVERALIGIDDEILKSLDIWKCLSCGICEEVCPSGVEFLDFIRKTRNLARKENNVGIYAHEGIFESLQKLMLSNEFDASEWLQGLDVGEDDTLYFAGCLPFYDIIFKDIGIKSTNIGISTIKILNSAGIRPAVMQSCCGHDALWNGNVKLFKELAKKNVKEIKEMKIKRIIFSCPECYRTFKFDYPKLNVEMMHISEFLEKEEIEWNGKEDEKTYTYHDSCRLGRHLGIYDEPRNVLKKVGIEIKEMEHNREMALCCGTSAWMCCDWKAEEMRKERLKEASDIADVLITSCPKCQIHFRCTLSHEGHDIEVKDFAEVVAERILKG